MTPFFWKCAFFCEHSVNSLENLRILPMGNVRHFRIIHKNDTLFLKMCVFREKILDLCIFREHLVNYLENLQILPMGNVRHFRTFRKNDALFLKMCVFR